MPNTPLKNRKLPPWITEAVKHWRWLEDRFDSLPEVTSLTQIGSVRTAGQKTPAWTPDANTARQITRTWVRGGLSRTTTGR